MKDMGIVQGSAEQAISLIIGKDTVYVHTDIEQLPPDDEREGVLFKYKEVQYDKDEYLQMMAKQNNNLENAVVELAQIALGEDSETNELSNLFAKKVASGELTAESVPLQMKTPIAEVQVDTTVKKKGEKWKKLIGSENCQAVNFGRR